MNATDSPASMSGVFPDMATPSHVIGFTLLTKTGGPLTKRTSLAPDGSLRSDGSACIMAAGLAARMQMNMQGFADQIAACEPSQAIALGSLRSDLPDQVKILTKARINDDTPPEVISRTGEYIQYQAGRPALMLIDSDSKGMPAAVKARIKQMGGIWPALCSILPELSSAAHVIRRSTTTGLVRSDTGERLPGSSGLHVFVLAQDGSDAERFLRTLHARAWLSSLGWLMIGKAGQFLSRSLIDISVSSAERLVFEGSPILDPPLQQDKASRTPKVVDGAALDTRKTCRDLSVVEQAKLRDLEAAEQQRLAPEAAAAKATFVTQHAERIVKRTGCKPDAARKVVERQCGGILLPSIVLPFDDEEFRGLTVGDVLNDPPRFSGATLSDPLEGPEYGVGKAKILLRSNNGVLIHSFAHGRTYYTLAYDAAAIEAAIMAGDEVDAPDILVRLLPLADVDRTEEDRLKALVCERAKAKPRSLGARIKQARAKQQQQQSEEAMLRRAAASRADRRIRLPAPAPDAPWLPTMQALNDVLGNVDEPEPPMRNVEGAITQVRLRRVPGWHALTSDGANAAEAEETRLPPAALPLLTRLSDPAVAELIETHIDHYSANNGEAVHLPRSFVEHFAVRSDDVLPIVTGISTLPIVRLDGTLVAKQGLDRAAGIVFRIPPELLAILPTPEQCDDAAVKDAFEFLLNDFLVDVLADFTGKCIAITALLTLIERSLLDDRPTFFVTAGRRGGGKTTLLIMLLMAITGVRPAAAVWSPNEEERRKAVFAYLLEGPPAIIWDNIGRGSQISCAHIERSCTSADVQDRILGVSERASVSTAAIHFFTDNNIGPKGDLASRSLKILLEITRADPENREYRHPDPIAWVEANRGKILVALYTLLLGNKTLRPRSNTAATARTRFKTWYRLVGSTVEHAASLAGHEIDFGTLFLEQEGEDEDNASLADALMSLNAKWAAGRNPTEAKVFTAADAVKLINDRQGEYQPDYLKEAGITLLEFLFPEQADRGMIAPIPSAKSVGRRLKKHCGEPVMTTVDSVNQAITLMAVAKAEGDPHAATTFWLRLS
jgi:hypothetical protein